MLVQAAVEHHGMLLAAAAGLSVGGGRGEGRRGTEAGRARSSETSKGGGRALCAAAAATTAPAEVPLVSGKLLPLDQQQGRQCRIPLCSFLLAPDRRVLPLARGASRMRRRREVHGLLLRKRLQREDGPATRCAGGLRRLWACCGLLPLRLLTAAAPSSSCCCWLPLDVVLVSCHWHCGWRGGRQCQRRSALMQGGAAAAAAPPWEAQAAQAGHGAPAKARRGARGSEVSQDTWLNAEGGAVPGSSSRCLPWRGPTGQGTAMHGGWRPAVPRSARGVPQ